MISPLGRSEKLFAVVAYVLVVGMAYGLSRVLSGRAVYIHMGAIFRDDYGGQRVDAHSARPTKDDRGH